MSGRLESLDVLRGFDMFFIFLLGSMLWTMIDGVVEKNLLSFEWSTFRVWSVIGRIGLAWGAVMRTVFNWNFESAYFFGGVCRFLSPEVGAFVTQAGMIALGWLFLYWLYRRNIFLRV